MAIYMGHEWDIAISPTPTGWGNTEIIQAVVDVGDRIEEATKMGSGAAEERVVATNRYANVRLTCHFTGGNVALVLGSDSAHELTIKQTSGGTTEFVGSVLFASARVVASQREGAPATVEFACVGTHTDSANGWGVS